MFIGCGPLCERDEFPHRPTNFDWKKQIQLPACEAIVPGSAGADTEQVPMILQGVQLPIQVLRTWRHLFFKVLCFIISRRQHTHYITSLLPSFACDHNFDVIFRRTQSDASATTLSRILAAKDIVFGILTDCKPLRINRKQVETIKDGHITYSLIYARLTVQCTGYRVCWASKHHMIPQSGLYAASVPLPNTSNKDKG